MRSSSTCTFREIDRPSSSRSDVFERLFVPDWILDGSVRPRVARCDAGCGTRARGGRGAGRRDPGRGGGGDRVGVRRGQLRRRRPRDAGPRGRQPGGAARPRPRRRGGRRRPLRPLGRDEPGRARHRGDARRPGRDRARSRASSTARPTHARLLRTRTAPRRWSGGPCSSRRCRRRSARRPRRGSPACSTRARTSTRSSSRRSSAARSGRWRRSATPAPRSCGSTPRSSVSRCGPSWHTIRTPVARVGAALDLTAAGRREDRSRRGAARADRGGRGSRRAPAVVVDDAAQAQPEGQHPRDRVRARRARARRDAHGQPRPGTRAGRRRVARGVALAHGCAHLRRRRGRGRRARARRARGRRGRHAAEPRADAGRRVRRAATFLLAERLGRPEARERVERAIASGRPLREELDLPDGAFDVEAAVATAGVVVDQALERYGAVR